MKKFALLALFALAGCGGNTEVANNAPVAPGAGADSTAKTGKVIVLYSEYPSWSAFGVASKQGLIDGAEGKLGPIEKQYNTDIVLSLRTYPICINEYGAVANTAVCITNVRSAT